MKKTCIIYGSTTGTTKAVAEKIGKLLEVDGNDILDVATIAPSKLADYDVLVLGTSTWGAGDLQEDWYDFIDGASALDLRDKTIAIFGCGDETMTDTFCAAVGTLYEKFKSTGAKMTGAFDADGYTFNNSSAYIDGQYVGLLLDEVNHPELTDLRLRRWTSQLKDEIK
ncbi:MAG: flavodoxin FldA [Bacteroides sp.]|nr:flavodoxin FldA [Bacteroides sp.]